MTEIVQGVNCKHCGAPLKLSPSELIITCEYCGSDFCLLGDKKFILKHSIIPNRYGVEEIIEILRSWMRSGFYKPEDLVRNSKLEEVECILLPFFIVHINASSKYTGILDRTGRKIEKSGELTKEYYWKILGRRGAKFPTVEYEIPLSSKTQFSLVYMPKNSKFLNSELDEEEAQAQARQEIEAHHRRLLSNEIDTVLSLETRFNLQEIEFLHASVWFIRYEYQGRNYEVLVDGASGEIIKGDIPSPDTSMRSFFSAIKKSLFR